METNKIDFSDGISIPGAFDLLLKQLTDADTQIQVKPTTVY